MAGVLLLVGSFSVLCLSDDPSPGHGGPLLKKSKLVTAQHGAVAADDYRCSTIGRDVLKDGGNAVDAAIATGLCIGVIQSFSSGIGGGGFMLIRPHGAPPELIDFREEAPAAASVDMFYDNITLAQVGGLAVGIPGELRGYELAHKRHGKLPWARLVQPSIDLCRRGFTMSTILAKVVNHEREWIVSAQGFNTTFVHPDGALLTAGDTVYRHNLAVTLEVIAKDGVEPFYN
ncbi:hypothetical protein EV182_001321, partial [Spiromyces aspiralis]